MEEDDRKAFLEFVDVIEQLVTTVLHRVPEKLAAAKAKIDAFRATIPEPQRSDRAEQEDPNATPA